MRIVGIDPGTLVCGYGVIEAAGEAPRVLDYGVVRSSHPSLPVRLKAIYGGLLTIAERFQPDVAVVEGVFFHKNVRSALKIGEGRGVALLAMATHGCPVVEYAPAEVKKAVVGTGRAHKSQIQQMVRLLLNLPDLPRPADAADALALAICHFHRLELPGS